ncbi:nuclear transport factor 2 family protein [Pseudomaricurvus sp. HS19]|uniref:nuclear transport factor 2 family protein n=1 Tax=Pseudomaricurvus sp. HS19 TaxID=2692626 RepID=UPI00137135B8|nr:nuclear transport factor 2 family protein [Pseudomaricurvus sp. HS19]MYM63920.1 nuclear transport factor 2 family protein [Pseudomaricurvus sp. HS19]
MARKVADIAGELADREAIRDTLMRYCRGTDRCDEELIRSTYWPDAHDDHLEFSGSRDEFIAYASPNLQAMRYNMHTLGNVLISLHGEQAEVESYYQGYHSVPDAEGNRRDVFAAGRYLDLFEKREDEWRILKRFVMVDWFRECNDSGDWEAGPFGMGDKVTRGDLAPADDSYQRLRRLDL